MCVWGGVPRSRQETTVATPLAILPERQETHGASDITAAKLHDPGPMRTSVLWAALLPPDASVESHLKNDVCRHPVRARPTCRKLLFRSFHNSSTSRRATHSSPGVKKSVPLEPDVLEQEPPPRVLEAAHANVTSPTKGRSNTVVIVTVTIFFGSHPTVPVAHPTSQARNTRKAKNPAMKITTSTARTHSDNTFSAFPVAGDGSLPSLRRGLSPFRSGSLDRSYPIGHATCRDRSGSTWKMPPTPTIINSPHNADASSPGGFLFRSHHPPKSE